MLAQPRAGTPTPIALSAPHVPHRNPVPHHVGNRHPRLHRPRRHRPGAHRHRHRLLRSYAHRPGPPRPLRPHRGSPRRPPHRLPPHRPRMSASSSARPSDQRAWRQSAASRRFGQARGPHGRGACRSRHRHLRPRPSCAWSASPSNRHMLGTMDTQLVGGILPRARHANALDHPAHYPQPPARNAHHVAEACFKATARALRAWPPRPTLVSPAPSPATKGSAVKLFTRPRYRHRASRRSLRQPRMKGFSGAAFWFGRPLASLAHRSLDSRSCSPCSAASGSPWPTVPPGYRLRRYHLALVACSSLPWRPPGSAP